MEVEGIRPHEIIWYFDGGLSLYNSLDEANEAARQFQKHLNDCQWWQSIYDEDQDQ